MHLDKCLSDLVLNLKPLRTLDFDTYALILQEVERYNVSADGYRESGFNNPNLSVDLHIGTEMDRTDDFVNKRIASKPCEMITTDEDLLFSYDL